MSAERGGTLVRLAALDAHPPVLDHVDAAVAVGADHAIELGDHLVQRRRDAVERHRDPPIEADHELVRILGCVRDRGGDRVHVDGWCDPRVFHGPALDGPADEVLVDRVRLLLRDGDRDVVACRVLDGVAAGEAPHAYRGEHLEIGRERPHADFEPHLVVALAGAAVRDRVRTELPGRGNEMSGDDRTRERRHQRVLPFVERVGLDRARNVLRGELRSGVDHDSVDCAGDERAPADRFEVAALADVDRQRDHLDAPFLLHPPHTHRRVEPTGVREDHPLHLFLPNARDPRGRRGVRRLRRRRPARRTR